jgi:hypothetical protein
MATRRTRRGSRSESELEAIDRAHTDAVTGAYGFDTPDVVEVQQGEHTGGPDVPVPVEVVGAVRVDELPTRSGGIFTRNVTTAGIRLIGDDPRRKLATVVPVDSDIRLGHTQAEAVMDGAGAVWPASVPFVYSSSDELWVAAVAGDTAVSVIVEHWAR